VEILFSFDVRLSVCVSVHSGPVNQTSLKWLKLRTSNMTCMFPGTVGHVPLKFFSKSGRRQGYVTPKFCWRKMLIAPKWFKLQTSNLVCIFPGTVQR